MQNNNITSSQARRTLIVLAALLIAFTSISLFVDLGQSRDQHLQLAAEVARSFYRAIDTMREWNLGQGGVYVRVSDYSGANPYLRDPLRDLVTENGLKLTLINHAQMTRVMSELLTGQRGIHIHITGLWPIRPGNAPDEWEKRALERFQSGEREVFEITGNGNGGVFRYIAPLRMRTTCFDCHQPQTSPDKATLGGVGVSFSYAPFQEVVDRMQRRLIAVHTLFLVIGLAILVGTGKKLLSSIRKLQESMAHIKRLEGLLPICAHCKSIRRQGEDPKTEQSWVAIEQYVQEHTDAEFTHGLCPRCARDLYPGLSIGGASQRM